MRKGKKMSKLEDLVPPLELCKRIPAGEFGNSALVWANNPKAGFQVMSRIFITFDDNCEHRYEGIPAPTLQEILDELARMGGCPSLNAILPVNWNVVYSIFAGWNLICRIGNNAAEAALKLWLEVNRINGANEAHEANKTDKED